MTDFNKILDKAKELEAKMKESQKNIKKIKVEGLSGSNLVKVILDGTGEMQSIEISDEILKEKTLKHAHIYCVINNINSQKYGCLIEKYIRIKHKFIKNNASNCNGDCSKDNKNSEIK